MRASSVEKIILEILSKENSHLTSHQIYERIRPRLPAVNPSTIYRALERLVKTDNISVSDMGTGALVYETRDAELHHHLVCQNCGHVFTIGNEDVLPFFIMIQNKHHFKIITNHLIIFGICEKCSHGSENP